MPLLTMHMTVHSVPLVKLKKRIHAVANPQQAIHDAHLLRRDIRIWILLGISVPDQGVQFVTHLWESLGVHVAGPIIHE